MILAVQFHIVPATIIPYVICAVLVAALVFRERRNYAYHKEREKEIHRAHTANVDRVYDEQSKMRTQADRHHEDDLRHRLGQLEDVHNDRRSQYQKEVAELNEKHRQHVEACVEATKEDAFEQGVREGESKQAILENQGRERFVDSARKDWDKTNMKSVAITCDNSGKILMSGERNSGKMVIAYGQTIVEAMQTFFSLHLGIENTISVGAFTEDRATKADVTWLEIRHNKLGDNTVPNERAVRARMKFGDVEYTEFADTAPNALLKLFVENQHDLHFFKGVEDGVVLDVPAPNAIAGIRITLDSATERLVAEAKTHEKYVRGDGRTIDAALRDLFDQLNGDTGSLVSISLAAVERNDLMMNNPKLMVDRNADGKLCGKWTICGETRLEVEGSSIPEVVGNLVMNYEQTAASVVVSDEARRIGYQCECQKWVGEEMKGCHSCGKHRSGRKPIEGCTCVSCHPTTLV